MSSSSILLTLISSLHCPTLSPTSRTMTQRQAEMLERDPERRREAIRTLLALTHTLTLEHSLDTQVKHFVVHLTRIAALDGEVEGLVMEVVGAARTWPRWLRLKAGRILVETAGRKDWGSGIVEWVVNERWVHVLAELAEAVGVYSFVISERRRTEIRAEVARNMQGVIKILMLAENDTEEESKDKLQAISGFVEWVHLEHFLTNNFFCGIMKLLSKNDCCLIICDILECMVRRILPTESLHLNFVQQIWIAAIEMIEILSNTKCNDQLKFILKAINLLQALMKNHMRLICGPTVFDAQLRHRFLSILQSMSLVEPEITLLVLSMWIALFKNYGQDPCSILSFFENRADIVKSVFEVVMQLFFKSKDWYALSLFEFETEISLFANIRGQTIHFVRLLVKLEPDVLIYLLLQRYKKCLPLDFKSNDVNHFFDGFYSANHPVVIEQEQCTSVLESIFKSLSVESFFNGSSELKQYSSDLVYMFLSQCNNFSASQPLVLAQHVYSLRTMANFFKAFPHFLPRVIELFFSCVQYLPSSNLLKLPESVRLLRKRACSSLLAFSAAMPKLLLIDFDVLLERSFSIIRNHLDVMDFEKTQLFQFLVMISNSMNREQQRNFIKVLMEPMIQELLSPSVLYSLTAFSNFISSYGLFAPNDGSTNSRFLIRSLLYNFSCVLRGIQVSEAVCKILLFYMYAGTRTIESNYHYGG